MKAQTAWMMYTGGYNWQFGKRQVDAMSNEEFNKRSSDYNMVIEEQRRVFKLILDEMQLEISKITPIQNQLTTEYANIERLKLVENVKLIKWMTQQGLDVGENIINDIAQTIIPDPNNDPNKFVPPKGPSTAPSSTTTSTPTTSSAPHNPNRNEQLSRDNIIRMYEEVKTLQTTLNQAKDIKKQLDNASDAARARSPYNYGQIINQINQLTATINSRLQVITAAQQQQKPRS